jgi:hypothetical protein
MTVAQGGGGSGKGWQLLQALRRGVVRAEALVRHPKELLNLLTLAERRLDGVRAGWLTPIKFADDAAVIGFILRKLRGELAAFEAWERGRAYGSQEGLR